MTEAVARLLEVGESMVRRLEVVERRLSKMSGEVPEGFTFEEIATLLKCNRRTIARRVASGEIGYFLIGSDKRIPKSELVRITAASFMHASSSMGPLPRKSVRPSGGSEGAKIRAANKKSRG